MGNDRAEEIFEKVYFKVLNFISFHQRSKKEISDRLSKYLSKYYISKAEKEKILKDITHKLEENGYVNDLNFSHSYIRSATNSRKFLSKRKIYQFLIRKGIHKDVISEALGSLPADFSLKNALKDGEKKLRLIGKIDAFSKKRKLSAYLYRKGYDSDTISSVVDTLL